MKNHKICIVGDGLSGLTTALSLKKLNIDIDFYLSSKKVSRIKDKRTTAISHSNYNFLKEKFNDFNSKLFWPCKKIELFYENGLETFNFLNFKEEKSSLMHIFENVKIKDLIRRELFKSKIKFIRKDIKNLKQLENSYDLIILCLGNNSSIYNNILNNRSIKKDYDEIAVTAVVRHNLKLFEPRQYFLKEGPLAFLPFSKNQMSIVWSLDKSFYKKKSKMIKKVILNKMQHLLSKKINFSLLNLQSFPIKLNLHRKYFKNNILVLGEGVHSIHPVAGQGFNLVLRDIKKLEEILEKNLNLGLPLKNTSILKDFNNSRIPENILLGLGIDLTHMFFKKNKYLDPFKPTIIKNLNKYSSFKKISSRISDKGLI